MIEGDTKKGEYNESVVPNQKHEIDIKWGKEGLETYKVDHERI